MRESSISVLIPAYNNNETLLRLLRSIKKQSIYKKLEIIVSDDCSPDILGISKDFDDIKNFLKINWYRQEKNLGILGNLVFLSKKATNRYVVFAQHDDYYTYPLFFEESLNFFLKESKLGIVFANSTFENTDNLYFNFKHKSPTILSGNEFTKLFWRNLMTSWSSLIFDLSAIEKFGGFGSTSYCLSEQESSDFSAYNQEEGMGFVFLISSYKSILIFSKSVSVRGLPPDRFSNLPRKNEEKVIFNDPLFFIFLKIILLIENKGTDQKKVIHNIALTTMNYIGLRTINFKILKFLTKSLTFSIVAFYAFFLDKALYLLKKMKYLIKNLLIRK